MICPQKNYMTDVARRGLDVQEGTGGAVNVRNVCLRNTAKNSDRDAPCAEGRSWIAYRMEIV